MGTLEIVGLILGSGVLVAIINQIGNYIFGRRKRKDDVEDKNDDIKSQINSMREDISSLISSVSEMVAKIDTVMKNSKAQAYDRIRHLGITYIRAGEVSVEDLRTLTELHEAYKQLGGDGFLDRVMEEVKSLRIKVE